MSTRRFPNWLQGYRDLTKHSEAPAAFHFWTGVSMIAGALRRRVWIDEYLFEWTPNFYIVLVAPPGVATKSTTINIGLRLLREVDGVKRGPNSLTWQGLTEAFKEAIQHIDIGEDQHIPMSCLTCAISELGTFLRPDNSELVDFLADIWDGQKREWKYKTKTAGGAELQTPWLNIIGCTTPAWLRQNFPAYLLEGGLTSRIIFAFANKKEKLIPYPSMVIDQEAFNNKSRALTEDLIIISQMQGRYQLTAEALLWGAAWYEKHWSKSDGSNLSERFSGYFVRKQSHIHKLAMVLAAAQRDELVITLEDMQSAWRIVTALEKDMDDVFQNIGLQAQGKNAAEILHFLKLHGTTSLMELTRNSLKNMDSKQLQVCLDSLVQAGLIELTLAMVSGSAMPVRAYKLTARALQDIGSESPEPPLQERS